jgi:hypothetical protein
MASEQSPELRDDEPNNELGFRAGEQDSETSFDDDKDVDPKVRKELYLLAAELDERLAGQPANPAATKPAEEGSDTYLG